MLSKEELLLIVYFIVVILLLTSFVVLFFVVYQRRKNKLLKDQFEARQRFEREIARSRQEMQEQTLKNVGWELHDNIGQLLSVAKMQVNILARTAKEDPGVDELKETLASALQEVRSLSKSLNNEVIGYAGLESSIRNELARFQRMGVIATELKTSGEQVEIPQQHSIILFRIMQEFFSNVIKHAQASFLEVRLHNSKQELQIKTFDNGRGFDAEQISRSSGLFNMKSRADLIGAKFELDSSPGKGTFLSLSVKIKGENNGQFDSNRR